MRKMAKRAAERLYEHMNGGQVDQGISMATVITDSPSVTIQLAGDTIALPLDYFVYPEGLEFRKDEIFLTNRIRGATSGDRQYALRPLNEGVMLGIYTGATFDIFDTVIKLPKKDVFSPYPLVPNVTNVMILPNRFPTPKEIWVVINTW